MRITFLGTSAGVPTRTRNVSSLALTLPERGEIWLFDCGEGTQHQLLRSDLRISHITRIFISHMHGDHIFGLMGLLATSNMAGAGQRIEIYGPPGLADYVSSSLRLSYSGSDFVSGVHTVVPGLVFENERFEVACDLLKHRIPAFGYRVTEKDRPGRFLVEKAAALGIPAGPFYGRLKKGERVELPDGRTMDGRELCEPPEPGRILVFCTDTIYCGNSVALARGADLLVHEATFAEEDLNLARRSLHSTAGMAARVALEAGAQRLLLTHFSPRYYATGHVQLSDLLGQARKIFPGTEMAYDLLSVDVPRRCHSSFTLGGIGRV